MSTGAVLRPISTFFRHHSLLLKYKGFHCFLDRYTGFCGNFLKWGIVKFISVCIAMVYATDGPSTMSWVHCIELHNISEPFMIFLNIVSLFSIALIECFSRDSFFQASDTKSIVDCPAVVLRVDDQCSGLKRCPGILEEQTFVLFIGISPIAEV